VIHGGRWVSVGGPPPAGAADLASTPDGTFLLVAGSPGRPVLPNDDLIAALTAAGPLGDRTVCLAAPWSPPAELIRMAAGLADHLRADVQVAVGLPTRAADGHTCRFFDGAGRPTWEPWLRRFTASWRLRRVIPADWRAASRPGPAAGTGPGVVRALAGWELEAIPAGLWLRPAGAPADAAVVLRPPDLRRPLLIVGVRDRPAPEAVWEHLTVILDDLPPSERAALGLLVAFRDDPRGDATARALARTHGLDQPEPDGATAATAAAPLAAHAVSAPSGAHAAVHTAPGPVAAVPHDHPTALTESANLRAELDPPAPAAQNHSTPITASTTVRTKSDPTAPDPHNHSTGTTASAKLRTHPEPPAPTPHNNPTAASATLRTQPASAAPDPHNHPTKSTASTTLRTHPEPTAPDPHNNPSAASAIVRTEAGAAAPVPLGRRGPGPVAGYVPRLATAEDRAVLRVLAGEHFQRYASRVEQVVAGLPGLRAACAGDDRADVVVDLVAVLLHHVDEDAPMSRADLVAAARRGAEGPAASFLACLGSGLRRLPTHRGPVVLAADAGVHALVPGAVLSEPAAVPALAGVDVDLAAPVELAVWSSTGRRTAVFGGRGEEPQVVFPPGTRFSVLEVAADGARVLLRETSGGEGTDGKARDRLLAWCQQRDAVPEDGRRAVDRPHRFRLAPGGTCDD
jgi:hypothetical protein